MSRSHFLRCGLAAMMAPSLSACLDGPTGPDGPGGSGNPRLTTRPHAPSLTPRFGETPLGLGSSRDGLLYVPLSYDPTTPAPLFVALHGATGSASGWAGFYNACEARGMVLLAVDSRDVTWDRVRGRFGADVPFIDLALNNAFDRCAIDPGRIALAGFSDGASYSLSLGLSNGDVFSHLVAFSPGGSAPAEPIVGRPGIFISHGLSDGVLSAEVTRLQIVPKLLADGYDVTYQEFDGAHEVPAPIGSQALDWFLA